MPCTKYAERLQGPECRVEVLHSLMVFKDFTRTVRSFNHCEGFRGLLLELGFLIGFRQLPRICGALKRQFLLRFGPCLGCLFCIRIQLLTFCMNGCEFLKLSLCSRWTPTQTCISGSKRENGRRGWLSISSLCVNPEA